MSKEYVTIKSNFHGGGIQSHYNSLQLAAEAAEKWKSSPGLAVGRIIDGKVYRQRYEQDVYGDYVLVESEFEPIPEKVDAPFAGARAYVL